MDAALRRRRRKQPVYRQLEFYVISAQDLQSVRNIMKTYVVAYVTPNAKVRSVIDEEGGNNPQWQQRRFAIQVEESLFKEDSTAQLNFDIYCQDMRFDICCHAFNRDKLVGSVRIPLTEAVRMNRHPYPITSYLVFTANGDSQGILNVCVPPGGRFPKRLDSLSFKRVDSVRGVEIQAVPSFKMGDDGIRGSTHDLEDEELGIYDDESLFGVPPNKSNSL